MADNLRKYTTQEVLNKVYTDSSGDTIGLQAQTSKETLNAVLNTSTNSLNVSLSGSNTISGDVTITGDLTVQGGGSLAFDEIIQGTLSATSANIGDTVDSPTSALTNYDNVLNVVNSSSTSKTASINIQGNKSSANETFAELTFSNVSSAETYNRVATIRSKRQGNDNSGSLVFSTALNSTLTDQVTITNSGNVGIGGDAVTKSGTFGDATTLGIVGTDGSGNGPSIQVAVDTTADARPMSLVFFNKNNADTSGATVKHIAAIRSFTSTSDSNADDDSGGDLRFYTKPESGNYDERMRIDSSGRLGLGISDPDAYLAGARNLVLGGTSGDHGLTIRSASDSKGIIALSLIHI